VSEFHVEVVRVGKIERHQNADTLSVTKVREYPVVIRSGDFKEGDLAVYVPVDSVVPTDDPRWEFLQSHTRIKAKRLRGIFSMGLLTKADAGWEEGQNVAELLRIKKYEPPEPTSTGGEAERCPFKFPKYTDIEGFRRWPNVFKDGEEVEITEKIHGTNSRFSFRDGRLWCGSHSEIKRDAPAVWWKAARQYELEKRLSSVPGIAIYGEIYGWVQDLRYGHSPGKVSLAIFDAFDLAEMRYFGRDEFAGLAKKLELPTVPVLYRGPFSRDLLSYAEGKTTLILSPAAHVREGIVIRPIEERFDERIQRVILKHHGEGYLLKG